MIAYATLFGEEILKWSKVRGVGLLSLHPTRLLWFWGLAILVALITAYKLVGLLQGTIIGVIQGF